MIEMTSKPFLLLPAMTERRYKELMLCFRKPNENIDWIGNKTGNFVAEIAVENKSF